MNPSPLVAVIVVIFTVEENALKALLIRRSGEPYQGWWALPGGLLSSGESLEEAATRKLREETGVTDLFLEQLYTFSDLDPQRPAVAVTYFALVDYRRVQLRQEEAWPPAWHAIAALPELAFRNNSVLEYALLRLRNKLEYTNIAYSLLPQSFTLSQLQGVYECIFERRLDKRNFRRRMLSLEIIRPTGKKQTAGAHRPAELYEFAKREPMVL